MNKKNFLKNAYFTLALFFSFSISAQTGPEVLKDWSALEEADFHFDVSYSVVKCNPNSNAFILINAFNEDGTHPKVGFTLNFSDNKGNKAQVIVAPFSTKLGDMMIASCDSDLYNNLKFEFPSNIDLSTMKINITYQTGI